MPSQLVCSPRSYDDCPKRLEAGTTTTVKLNPDLHFVVFSRNESFNQECYPKARSHGTFPSNLTLPLTSPIFPCGGTP